MLIADEARMAIRPSGDAELFAILNSEPKYLRLGSIGPDLTFFAPDYGDSAVELVRAIAGFYDEFVGPLVEIYEKYVEPVVTAFDEIGDVAEATLDAATCNLVGDLFEEVDRVSERMSALGEGALGSIFALSINIFDAMTPLIQRGETIDRWFWFDTLHNRRTGPFISAMWDRALDDKSRAYVLGYSTHYACDVIGHQFVNTVVGSPARSQLQRHHFTENMIDSLMYDYLRTEEINPEGRVSGELTASKLHLSLPFGEVVEGSGSLLRLLDNLNEEPPDEVRPVFQMIANSLEATFQPIDHPRRLSSEYLTSEHLNVAFWLTLVALRASTSSYIPVPKFPGDRVIESVTDAMADFLGNVANPPVPSPSVPDACFAFWSSDCDFSLESLTRWARAAWSAVSYCLDLLRWFGEVVSDLWGVFSCTLTAPARLAMHGAFYIIHETLHYGVTRLREVMVQAALIYPDRDWVKASPVAASLIRVSDFHRNETAGDRYPRRAPTTNEGFQRYPSTTIERPFTDSSGFQAGTTAIDLIRNFVVDERSLTVFGELATPEQNREFARRRVGQPLGSLVPYSVHVMRTVGRSQAQLLPDLSLDADRGYAHRNWQIEPGAESSVTAESEDPEDPVPYTWSE